MAGNFITSRYVLDAGNGGGIAGCRIQPETLAATINSVTNAATTDPTTLPASAKVSKTNREFGVGMRTVTLEFTGALPDGYSGDPVRIPVMQPATFAAWTIGQTGTYLSSPVVVVGRSPESVR